MSFTSFDQPTNGALTDGGTELVYLSNPRYYGVDPFTFYVQDASGVIGSGICTVVVNPGAGPVRADR
ncbi:cadherin-like domain-containing protein [Endozoicomonas sp. SCSIO W0465]|nr:cadherin-like domain-containing protein [Endozoicomonas sp. SCSIO W0465]USE37479.1 cadherin-like domain-containing protein [Endozoicomonas sp. SCSIO W0465]